VKRFATSMFALAFIVGTQPTYVCAVRCLLGHGPAGSALYADSGLSRAHHTGDPGGAPHRGPSQQDCHGSSVSADVTVVTGAASPAPPATPTVAVVAVATTVPSSIDAPPRGLPRVPLAPEPPPPRI